MLQARKLGKELYVGVHSDEEILKHKGPPVMTLEEREEAVKGCRWCSVCIPYAPYVTDPKVMDQYRCRYVVHGDDITTDENGEDCYRVVKELGRFIVVKRTPNISTTDLVGRMLLYTKSHHLQRITGKAWEQDSFFSDEEISRFKEYATAQDGHSAGPTVLVNTVEGEVLEFVSASQEIGGKMRENGIFYIDGGFDLFHTGHIEVLRMAKELADSKGCALIAGVNDDSQVNAQKGRNYPIMNLFERSLCVLQSKYIDGIVLGAPYKPTVDFLGKLGGRVVAVLHGPTAETGDPYSEVRELLVEMGSHKYDKMSTETIVARVLENRMCYEERQKKKGWTG